MSSILSAAYSHVQVGDVFTWSFDVNSWDAASSAALELKFGTADIVTLATATATDAAAGGLGVIFQTNTANSQPVYGDNINLSVTTNAPEPMSLALLGVGIVGATVARRFRRR